MADFNTNVTPVQPNEAPMSPVQDTSAAQAINSLGGLFGGVASSIAAPLA